MTQAGSETDGITPETVTASGRLVLTSWVPKCQNFGIVLVRDKERAQGVEVRREYEKGVGLRRESEG